MADRSTLDPIAEAEARIRLRHRRARALRQPAKPVGLALQRLARKTIPDKGPAIAKLKTRWSDIVGEQIAKFCRPEKIAASKDGRILTLRVIPAAAPMIQHQSETIRQRVSASMGGDITRLKLVQGQLHPGAPPQSKPEPARSLTPEEFRELQEKAANIEDPALRDAIVSLGRAVLSRQR